MARHRMSSDEVERRLFPFRVRLRVNAIKIIETRHRDVIVAYRVFDEVLRGRSARAQEFIRAFRREWVPGGKWASLRLVEYSPFRSERSSRVGVIVIREVNLPFMSSREWRRGGGS